jgi:hypothetical protein
MLPPEEIERIAVAVIKSPYPADQIPLPIQRLIANTITEETSLLSSQQTDETKRLVANAVRVLDKSTQPDPLVLATVQQLPVRVYMQIADEQQREKVQELQSILRQRGFLVPGIEKIGEKQAVKKTEVRYFDDSDKVHADQVQSIVTHTSVG